MPLISITLPSQQLFQDLVLVIAGTMSHGQTSRVGGHEESECRKSCHDPVSSYSY